MSNLRTDRCTSLALYLPYLHSDLRYQISSLNVRSLHKHSDCLHVTSRFSVKPELDPLTLQTIINHIDTFNSILYHGISTRGYRSHQGLALHSKQPILMSEEPLTPAEDSEYTRFCRECLFTAVTGHEKFAEDSMRVSPTKHEHVTLCHCYITPAH